MIKVTYFDYLVDGVLQIMNGLENVEYYLYSQ